MFKRFPGIGLDISNQKIRLIWVERKKNGFKVLRFGSIKTPAGAVESGIIIDPQTLGDAMGELVKELKLKGKRVAAAVGGQQIYIRNLIMPQLEINEMKAAAYYQAIKFLPIPVEDAAIDVFPIRNFEDEEGKKTELFFLAVRKQQVINLEIACVQAGLKLNAVEIEPLSLFRVLGGASPATVGLLVIDPSRSYLTVFHKGIPVFYRCITTGLDNHYGLDSDGFNKTGKNTQSQMKNEAEQINPMKNMLSEIILAFEYYQHQIKRENESIDRILLCAGGEQKKLEQQLEDRLGINVELANIVPKLIHTNHISTAEICELRNDFPVALGLAARKVI